MTNEVRTEVHGVVITVSPNQPDQRPTVSVEYSGVVVTLTHQVTYDEDDVPVEDADPTIWIDTDEIDDARDSADAEERPIHVRLNESDLYR